MLSGPTHLQCPACGHVFMSVESRPDGNETCPHCAAVGPRTHFRALAPSPGAEPIRFQKRVPRAHEVAPVQQPQPAVVELAQVAHEPRVHHTSHPSNPPKMAPAAWAGFGTENQAQNRPQVQEYAIEPQKKSSLLFWVTATLLFIAVCGFTGMLAWEKINRRIQQLRAEKIAKAGVPVSSTRQLPIPSLKIDPMEELNQRVLTGSAMAEADRLIKVLFNSATTAERLKAIANPDEHQAEVAAMFDDAPAKPALVALTPISHPPHSLLTQQPLPMFKVVTTLNRSGALVSTTTIGTDEPLISWPLFHETHDGLLAKHIEGKKQQPKWFHVGLRRFHSFDLSPAVSTDFDAIDIDGSTDGSAHIVTYVAKESPLGRHLTRTVEWGKFYFGRVLVSWMDIAGEMRPALLDCEGSTLPENGDAKPPPGN